MFAFNPLHSRSYATLKDIQLRLKSIKNIGKITKSMKMIASTKLNRAQKAMEVGQTFGKTASAALEHIKVMDTSDRKDGNPLLLLACSSDRGLCGAIHSSVSKFVKKLVADGQSSGAVSEIVVLGDKAKPQIARGCRKNIVLSFNQVGKDIPTFTDALAVSELVLARLQAKRTAGAETESAAKTPDLRIVYNQFKSVIAYETVPITVHSPDQLRQASNLAAFEYGDAALEAYSQFVFASQLFRALVDGHASEMSAKRMAMENASKNSDEIVLKLTMQYNRTRQTVITNELVDIITGASAL